MVVPIDHDIFIVLIPELPVEPFVYRVIAELKCPLLHHLIDFGGHPDATPTPSVLIQHALQPDVVPGGVMLESRRVKVDVHHVALEGRLARGGWEDLVVVVGKLARIHAMGDGVPAACCLSYAL